MKRMLLVLAALVALVLAGVVGAGIYVLTDSADDNDAGDTPERTESAEPSESAGESESASESATESAAPDVTEPPDPALASYYSQTLDWSACQSGFECATLTVPIDYADPEGETIELALLKVPAQGDRVGSLVVNPGGPGAPGTQYAAAAERVFRQPLLDAFDIVGFDPRGTGESSPVDCLSDEDLDAFYSADPDPDTAAEGEAFVDDVQSFADGCAELSPELSPHVSTEEAARDMDVLRAALGESTLTYFGASYGTKLGATYANLFPERVGRFVLDGAVDVSLSSRELSLGQARGFETALRAYVENCIEVSDSCYLGDSVEEGLTTIKDFMAEVDAEPLTTDSDRVLTEGNAFYGLITPLYSRENWSILSTYLKDALDGDGTGLLLLSDFYASREPTGGYSDNSSEAILAINCLDDPWAIGADEVEGQVAEFEEASPTLGRVFAWGLTGCGGFDYPAAEPLPDVLAVGAAPIVVVGTTRDPATPYEWSQALAEHLDSGVLVTRDGDGHTGYNSGNECVDTAIEDYLVDGVVPDDGLTC